MRATQPGTGNAGVYTSDLVDPVASLSNVEPSQRAERCGFSSKEEGLRYVLIPGVTQLS
jgi:hypothetical protein